MARTRSTRLAKPPGHRTAVSEDRPDQYFSRALEKGLKALHLLSEAQDGLTLTEAATKLGLTKASAFRIVRTLEILGHAVKAADGKYALAGAGKHQLPSRSIQAMLQRGPAPLRDLALEFRETASMAAVFENHIEVVLVVESPQLIRMGNTVGRILPPHASSLGKAISAFQQREDCERLLRSYGTSSFTANTITDELVLQKEFDQIRSAGYAEDREESTPGGVCFAAPILLSDHVAIGAISLSMPKMRLEASDHRKRIVQAVMKTATAISSQIRRVET